MLTARRVATAGVGNHLDGDGLYLCVAPTFRRTWVYRFSWNGRRPEMGLGAYPEVSLAQARDLRDEAKRILRSGQNPIEQRRIERRSGVDAKTFGAVADAFLAAKSPQWRNEKHREQWRISIEDGMAALRPKMVAAIDTEVVLAVLKPTWLEKPESAQRLRTRLEAVLDAAKAQGLRDGENPARWRGHLQHLLPKRQNVEKSHHAALPYQDAPAFIARLRTQDYIAARALEFAVLTAARSGEVYGARWSEIDMDGKVWTIPAERMKSGRAHRVPLSGQAIAILKPLAVAATGDLVFESPRGRRPLSHVAMAKVMDRLGVVGPTVHGFRSTFRDWAGNETAFPREIAEAALAHVVGDKAEQAYRRSDALERRRELMEDWAVYVGSVSVPEASQG